MDSCSIIVIPEHESSNEMQMINVHCNVTSDSLSSDPFSSKFSEKQMAYINYSRKKNERKFIKKHRRLKKGRPSLDWIDENLYKLPHWNSSHSINMNYNFARRPKLTGNNKRKIIEAVKKQNKKPCVKLRKSETYSTVENETHGVVNNEDKEKCEKPIKEPLKDGTGIQETELTKDMKSVNCEHKVCIPCFTLNKHLRKHPLHSKFHNCLLCANHSEKNSKMTVEVQTCSSLLMSENGIESNYANKEVKDAVNSVSNESVNCFAKPYVSNLINNSIHDNISLSPTCNCYNEVKSAKCMCLHFPKLEYEDLDNSKFSLEAVDCKINSNSLNFNDAEDVNDGSISVRREKAEEQIDIVSEEDTSTIPISNNDFHIGIPEFSKEDSKEADNRIFGTNKCSNVSVLKDEFMLSEDKKLVNSLASTTDVCNLLVDTETCFSFDDTCLQECKHSQDKENSDDNLNLLMPLNIGQSSSINPLTELSYSSATKTCDAVASTVTSCTTDTAGGIICSEIKKIHCDNSLSELNDLVDDNCKRILDNCEYLLMSTSSSLPSNFTPNSTSYVNCQNNLSSKKSLPESSTSCELVQSQNNKNVNCNDLINNGSLLISDNTLPTAFLSPNDTLSCNFDKTYNNEVINAINYSALNCQMTNRLCTLSEVTKSVCDATNGSIYCMSDISSGITSNNVGVNLLQESSATENASTAVYQSSGIQSTKSDGLVFSTLYAANNSSIGPSKEQFFNCKVPYVSNTQVKKNIVNNHFSSSDNCTGRKNVSTNINLTEPVNSFGKTLVKPNFSKTSDVVSLSNPLSETYSSCENINMFVTNSSPPSIGSLFCDSKSFQPPNTCAPVILPEFPVEDFLNSVPECTVQGNFELSCGESDLFNNTVVNTCSQILLHKNINDFNQSDLLTNGVSNVANMQGNQLLGCSFNLKHNNELFQEDLHEKNQKAQFEELQFSSSFISKNLEPPGNLKKNILTNNRNKFHSDMSTNVNETTLDKMCTSNPSFSGKVPISAMNSLNLVASSAFSSNSHSNRLVEDKTVCNQNISKVGGKLYALHDDTYIKPSSCARSSKNSGDSNFSCSDCEKINCLKKAEITAFNFSTENDNSLDLCENNAITSLVKCKNFVNDKFLSLNHVYERKELSPPCKKFNIYEKIEDKLADASNSIAGPVKEKIFGDKLNSLSMWKLLCLKANWDSENKSDKFSWQLVLNCLSSMIEECKVAVKKEFEYLHSQNVSFNSDEVFFNNISQTTPEKILREALELSENSVEKDDSDLVKISSELASVLGINEGVYRVKNIRQSLQCTTSGLSNFLLPTLPSIKKSVQSSIDIGYTKVNNIVTDTLKPLSFGDVFHSMTVKSFNELSGHCTDNLNKQSSKDSGIKNSSKEIYTNVDDISLDEDSDTIKSSELNFPSVACSENITSAPNFYDCSHSTQSFLCIPTSEMSLNLTQTSQLPNEPYTKNTCSTSILPSSAPHISSTSPPLPFIGANLNDSTSFHNEASLSQISLDCLDLPEDLPCLLGAGVNADAAVKLLDTSADTADLNDIILKLQESAENLPSDDLPEHTGLSKSVPENTANSNNFITSFTDVLEHHCTGEDKKSCDNPFSEAVL